MAILWPERKSQGNQHWKGYFPKPEPGEMTESSNPGLMHLQYLHRGGNEPLLGKHCHWAFHYSRRSESSSLSTTPQLNEATLASPVWWNLRRCSSHETLRYQLENSSEPPTLPPQNITILSHLGKKALNPWNPALNIKGLSNSRVTRLESSICKM